MSSSILSVVLTLSFGLSVVSCGKGGWLNKKLHFRKNKNEFVQQPSDCQKPSVIHLNRTDAGLPDESKFASDYTIQYIPPTTPGAPVVVYFPGGPGQASIGNEESMFSGLPEGYGLVLTDPRGVGCNYVASVDLPLKFYSSNLVAKDVVAAVKHLNINNYIFYGISYGTVPATIAASITQDAKAVVLEGVLGRAALTSEENYEIYNVLLAEKFAKLSVEKGAKAVNAFKKEPLPLGLSGDEWMNALVYALMVGPMKDEKEIWDPTYMLLSRALSKKSQERTWAKDIVLSLNEDETTLGSDEFYLAIGCTEIMADLRDSKFVDGSLKDSGKNICKEQGIGFDRGYDATKYQVKIPIYYMQGEDDPATAVEFAMHHYQGQKSSNHREMLLVKEAGHNPMSTALVECSAKLWQQIANVSSLDSTISSCAWDRGIEVLH